VNSTARSSTPRPSSESQMASASRPSSATISGTPIATVRADTAACSPVASPRSRRCRRCRRRARRPPADRVREGLGTLDVIAADDHVERVEPMSDTMSPPSGATTW
jgi:hypothetical protein